MATTKFSTTLSPDLVREAKSRAGKRKSLRDSDEALDQAIQRDRLVDLEHELTEAYGPIADDIKSRIDRVPWPK